MFYTQPDRALRFGDVIAGFIASVPKLKEPIMGTRIADYQLELSMPEFCVVLSPCCSIGSSTITLAPLEQVMARFFANPYFQQDLTNINRRVPPEQSIPPENWQALKDEERQRKLDEGFAFTFMEYFIYAENEMLPKYNVKYRQVEYETGCYMIDFRKSFRVSCEKIKNPTDSPLDVKLIQLSVETRQELRTKISFYYSRIPQEDRVLLRS